MELLHLELIKSWTPNTVLAWLPHHPIICYLVCTGRTEDLSTVSGDSAWLCPLLLTLPPGPLACLPICLSGPGSYQPFPAPHPFPTSEQFNLSPGSSSSSSGPLKALSGSLSLQTPSQSTHETSSTFLQHP